MTQVVNLQYLYLAFGLVFLAGLVIGFVAAYVWYQHVKLNELVTPDNPESVSAPPEAPKPPPVRISQLW